VAKLTDLQTLRLQELCNFGRDPRGVQSTRRRYWTIDPETTAALASALAALPHLVELDLCGNNLPPAAANVLARELQQLTGLTRLKLFDNESMLEGPAIEYDFESGCRLLEGVGRMAALRSFSMLGCFFGMAQKHAQEEQPELVARALGALGGLTRLEELDMRRNVFSGAAATALAGTLTRLTQLKELTIGQPWGDGHSFTSAEAVAALTAPLGALTSLTKLSTYEGPCSSATIETLASALARMPALTWLDVGGYKDSCGPAGATALAGVLRNLTRLKTLQLQDNGFGAPGAAALAPAFTRLQTLGLASNEFGNQGAAALAPALQRLTGLTYLNLAHNGLMHDKKRLVRDIQQLEIANAKDKDKRLEQLEVRLKESVETIDVLKEAQELRSSLECGRQVLDVSIHPQPSFDAFSQSMHSARERNVRVLHLAGHGGRRCGFFWLKNQAASTEYEEISLDRFARIVKTELAGDNGGTIECVVLNACETEEMGKNLRGAGALHVVCWRSAVEDIAARNFALEFYASLKEQDPSQAMDYKRAFRHAAARIRLHGGAVRGRGGAKCKYLAKGAVNYVGFLSKDGNEFPDTGQVRPNQEGGGGGGMLSESGDSFPDTGHIPAAAMQLVSRQGAHEGQEADGGKAVDTPAQPSASHRRLPVIEGFFCKNSVQKQLLRDIANAMDKRLEQLKLQLDNALPLGLGVLAPALAELALLTHLNLRGNDETGGTHSEAIEKLADSLKKTTNMTELYLPHVRTPGWCQPLRDALLCMTSLAELEVGEARPDEMDWGMALPEEVTRSWMGTLAYVRELGAQGAVPCSMLRLLIIGMGEAGKTCLKQALMSDTDLSPPIATDDRTIGIDTHPSWKPDGEDLDFTVWDFAGQRGYQTGHSPFLSERCLSMLVFRPDQGASAEAIFEEWVRPWLELLHAHSPGAHVLLVCTRWMSPPADEELGAYQRRIRDICEGISKFTRAQVEKFNKATKEEVKRLGEKASKLEQELKRVEDEMQAPPPAHGGHGARRREALKRQSEDWTEELKAARNRRTKLCHKRSQEAKQMQILAAAEGANACANMVHLVESVEGDGSTVKSLREALVRTARGLPFVGENIPRGWLTLKKEIETFYQHDKPILVKRDSLMPQLRRDSPQLQTWLIGPEAEDRVLDCCLFWELLGFMLVTPDQSHVIVSPPKLIDLLKPLVHHQPFSKLEGTGQAHAVVEKFDGLDLEVQGKIREMFERLEDRYILDMTLLKCLRFWAPMDASARDQALQVLCDLNLVVPHRGGVRSADEQRFLCFCRLNRDSHSSLLGPGPVLPDIKVSVKYTIVPILPLGLFPRFLAAQLVARSTDRQSQPRISPTSLYMRVSPLGKDQKMLIKLNPSDSIIEVRCTSIGLLRDVCYTLEQTVNHLFPGLSFHTQLRFPYEEKGMFTWDIHPHVVGHSFGALLAQKLWNKTKMDAIKPERVENAVENVATAEYNVQLKSILEPTLGLTASFFLSHCWKDKSKDYAKDFVSKLEDVSRDLVWYDEEQLERVNHFPSKMQEGVKQAECIIIFLSRVYLSRQNCLLELQWAWEEHLLKGKSLIVLPVDEAVTVDSLREWAQRGINLPVQEQPDQGGTFTIHHNTLKFVSEKLTGFLFFEEWRLASFTEEERWKAVQEICDYVGDARAEHGRRKEVPKKAKLKCRADSDTWMLEDLGEEDVSDTWSLPPCTEIVDLFKEKKIFSCERVCAALGVTTLDDLRMVKFADVEELKTTLKLTPVEIEKLRLLLCQIETPAAEQGVCSEGAGNLTREKRARSPQAQVHHEDRQKHAKLTDLAGPPAAGEAHSGDKRACDELDAELKAKFAEYGLGSRCEEICAQLEVDCVSDLVLVERQDVEDLKLKSVTKRKLLNIIRSTRPSGADGGGGGGGIQHKGGGGKRCKPKFGDGPRVALCIGNDNYPGSSCLPNCVADAEDMGHCFERLLGFDRTIILKDANKSTIMQAVREMREEHIKDGSLVGFFFSGHGVEHEGVSYLLPLGMTSTNQDDLPEEAVSLDFIMRGFSNFTSTVNLLLLDCCRENEFNGTFKNSKGSADYDAKGVGNSVAKSLRSTSRNAEFVVGSACDSGTLALSNAGVRNSRYTEALLRHLPVAGRKLEESMKEAIKDVFEATHKKQRPWVNSCLMQDVVLVRA
jgi:GTPase SAR1 family protein